MRHGHAVHARHGARGAAALRPSRSGVLPRGGCGGALPREDRAERAAEKAAYQAKYEREEKAAAAAAAAKAAAEAAAAEAAAAQ